MQIKETPWRHRHTGDTRQIQSDFIDTQERLDANHSRLQPPPGSPVPFDARGIAKRFRHAAIFGALDA
jgi:hypothetical protein